MSKPGVTADNAVIANFCVTSKNGCVCIYNNIIADIGVTLDIFNGCAVFVKLKAFCTESNALINFNVVSNCCGFADNDTCTMVNEKIFANSCTCVNINTCFLVGIFRHNTGNKRNLKGIKLMSKTKN